MEIGGIDTGKLAGLLKDWSDNRDLLGGLPDFLDTLTAGLRAAGDHARNASAALGGDGSDGGASGRLGSAATALTGIAGGLGTASGFVTDVAEDVRKVPLLDAPAAKLGKVATTLDGARENLGGLADEMVALGRILDAVADALAKLGDSLDSSVPKTAGRIEKRTS